MRTLKHESIRAEIREGMKADEALLAEIDGNLIHAELSPAETAKHYVVRKVVYEKLHPETVSVRVLGAWARQKVIGKPLSK